LRNSNPRGSAAYQRTSGFDILGFHFEKGQQIGEEESLIRDPRSLEENNACRLRMPENGIRQVVRKFNAVVMARYCAPDTRRGTVVAKRKKITPSAPPKTVS